AADGLAEPGVVLELLPHRGEGERFEQVLHDPAGNGSAHDLEIPSRGDGDHVRVVAAGAQRAGDLQTVHVRQPDVQQHQVDGGVFDELQGLLPGAHSADDLEPLDPVDVGLVRLPGHRVV